MKIEELRQGQLVWPTVVIGVVSSDAETAEDIAAIERLPLDKLGKPATVIATANGLFIVDADSHVRNVRPDAGFLDVEVSKDADCYHATLADAIDAGATQCEESADIETNRAAAMRRLAERARRQAEAELKFPDIR